MMRVIELALAVLTGCTCMALLGMAFTASENIRNLREVRRLLALRGLVQAAEQIYGAGKGEAKRRYVREKMTEKHLPITREDVEAAVYELTRAAQ